MTSLSLVGLWGKASAQLAGAVRPTRLGIAGQLAAWATAFGTAIVVTLGAYINTSSVNVLLDRERITLATAVDRAAARVDLFVASARQDVAFLALVPPLAALATAAGENDASDRLAGIFSALMGARPEYFQIRLIGEADDGQELVRVQRLDGEAVRTPEDQLQPKGDRPYFQAAAALPAGSIYVSDVELNQEFGRIETPHRPTLRVATPVHDAAGGLYGIVIINVDAASLFGEAGRGLHRGASLMMTNDGGDYLLHPDPALAFGFDLGERHRIQDDYPDLAGLYAPGGEATFVDFIGSITGQQLAAASRVSFDPDRPGHHLMVAAVVPRAELLAGIAAERRSIVLVALALILGGATVAIVLASLITKPLRRVTQAANDLAAGNRAVDLTGLGARRDETGDLARAFSVMARQIARREEQLASHTRDLERSNADLAQFAYVASHDLQEPLRMVSGYVELLRQRYQGKLDPEADEFINFAVDGAGRMRQLINDLLGYARASHQPMNLTVVDIDPVLDAVLQTLSEAIAESGAEVSHAPLPSVHGDTVQLERLLARLIENAIKYRSKAPPRIHLAAERQGGFWLFSVADNGIGIDPRFRDRVFEIFKRLHGRKHAGTGIGLAVCRMVVERHGGKIWVDDAPGGGSTFYFTLPAAPREATKR